MGAESLTYPVRECLISWANEVHDVGNIIWEKLLVKLAAVEAEDK